MERRTFLATAATVSLSGPLAPPADAQRDPAFMVHGFPRTSLIWRFLAPNLAASHTVICVDLRGYGRSGTPASSDDHFPYSKRAIAKELVEAMLKLGFPSFTLMGRDRGGRVAYLFSKPGAGRTHASRRRIGPGFCCRRSSHCRRATCWELLKRFFIIHPARVLSARNPRGIRFHVSRSGPCPHHLRRVSGVNGRRTRRGS
jgi:hypothetical protein